MEQARFIPKRQKVCLLQPKTKNSSPREKNRILAIRSFFLICVLVLLIGGKILFEYYMQKMQEQESLFLQKEALKAPFNEKHSVDSLFERIMKKFFLQDYNRAQIVSF